jgi:hypothetical protein
MNNYFCFIVIGIIIFIIFIFFLVKSLRNKIIQIRENKNYLKKLIQLSNQINIIDIKEFSLLVKESKEICLTSEKSLKANFTQYYDYYDQAKKIEIQLLQNIINIDSIKDVYNRTKKTFR